MSGPDAETVTPLDFARCVPEALAQAWPPRDWSDRTVILAVSGGADSMALLRAMASIRTPGVGRLIVCHFNHHLRSTASDADEAFVVQSCQQLELQCEVGHWQRDSSGSDRLGREGHARRARYEFFAQLANSTGARYVATAHTADDQVETVLHHLLRGTGLAGLSGMPPVRPLGAATLIRPLLQIQRADLIRYLDHLGQAFREDDSNADCSFTRNRIRRQLIPQLEQDFNPHVREAVLRLAKLAGEAQSAVEHAARELAAQCIAMDSTDSQISIDLRRVQGRPRHLLRELFVLLWRDRDWPRQGMTQAHWECLAEAALSPDPHAFRPQTLPGAIRAVRDGHWLRLLASGSNP